MTTRNAILTGVFLALMGFPLFTVAQPVSEGRASAVCFYRIHKSFLTRDTKLRHSCLTLRSLEYLKANPDWGKEVRGLVFLAETAHEDPEKTLYPVLYIQATERLTEARARNVTYTFVKEEGDWKLDIPNSQIPPLESVEVPTHMIRFE